MNTTGVLQRTAAVLVGGAAAIHLGVAGAHFGESWLAGAFFLVLAAFQATWTLLCWQPVRNGWLLAGTVVNTGAVALWALSRTVGLPIGPHAGDAEPVGFADVTATAFEGLAVAVTVFLVVQRRRRFAARPVARRTAAAVVAVAAAVVMTVGGVAIAAPGGGHGTGAGATAAHDHDEGGHSHGNGDAHDLPQLPDTSKATAEQTEAARQLLERTITATGRYRDPKAAKGAGFDLDKAQQKWAKKHPKAEPKAPIRALHVPNTANRKDDRLVDPSAPETLIYRRTAQGDLLLVGVMFTAQGGEPPASYQPYLRWHFHQKKDTEQGKTGYMTHLWFVRTQDLVHGYALKAPTAQLDAYQATLR